MRAIELIGNRSEVRCGPSCQRSIWEKPARMRHGHDGLHVSLGCRSLLHTRHQRSNRIVKDCGFNARRRNLFLDEDVLRLPTGLIDLNSSSLDLSPSNLNAADEVRCAKAAASCGSRVSERVKKADRAGARGEGK